MRHDMLFNKDIFLESASKNKPFVILDNGSVSE